MRLKWGTSSIPTGRAQTIPHRSGVLAFTEEIARRFGEENARLLAEGQPISQFDLAIAATALHHGMVLLSENRKHYRRIPTLQLESLKANS